MAEARAIVVGGGVGGASIAYHLTELGWTDVLLVERDELTSGSTFHSAGLVGQLRSSVTLTRMMMYGADLYRRLHEETGIDPGWHEVGSLRLASSAARMEELSRLAGWGRTFGLPLELVSTDEALARFPLFDPAGVLGAAFLPTDGWLDPTGLTQALAEAARRRGAEIREHTRVTGISVRDGRVRGVETEHGPIAADVVVDAGGMYANQIGRMAGVEVPVVPFGHQYLITEPIDGARADLPTLRDPDRLVYFRQEAGGALIVGGYERLPAPWAVQDGPPADFNHRLLPEDWERFEPLAEGAFSVIPALKTAGVVRMLNGPEAFTPDGEFILGESDVRGFFVAAGFCAHGIAGAGGIGKVMADWIVHGEPEMDVWEMDIRRFGPQYRSRSFALARAYEVYARYYDIHYPGEERQAGRPLKLSPTYARLQDLDAEFGEKSGWERPNWFRSNEDAAFETMRPKGWAGEHWSTAIVAEHRATRERAALFDESSFAKLDVRGPGAAAFLQRIAAGDVDRPVGTVVYTQLLNARGGIESDLTVTRLDADHFRLVTGTAFGRHDLGWIRKQLAAGGDPDVDVRDVTASEVCFGLWGPLATRRALGRRRRRPLERGVPLHDRPPDRGRSRAVRGGEGDLRRRAWLGAVRVGRVRRSSVGRARGGRLRPRRRRGGVSGDRLAPAREGLSGLELRHHPRGRPVRSRPRLRRQDGQAELRRSRGAGGATGTGTEPHACLSRARGSASDDPRQRAGVRRGNRGLSGDVGRDRVRRRAVDRLRVPSGRDGRAGHGARGGGLRRTGSGGGLRAPALGSRGQTSKGMSDPAAGELPPGHTLVATVRHGLTELNRDRRVGGRVDAPLIDEGRDQAREARRNLPGGYEVVVSSPLVRAVETAELVTGWPRERLVVDESCAERSFGRMEGMRPEDVRAQFPEVEYLQIGDVGYSLNPPEGESFEALAERAAGFVGRTVERFRGRRILVFSHQNFLQQVHGVLRGLGPMAALETDILNCELNEFLLDAAGALVRERTVQLVPSAGDHPSF